MRKSNPVLYFVRLPVVARQLGAKSQANLVADLRTLTHRERREVAELVKKGG